MESKSGCPLTNGAGRSNRDWWPNRIDLSVLHQNPPASDPMGEEFDKLIDSKNADMKNVGGRYGGSIAAAPIAAASATTEPPAAPAAEGKVTDFLGYGGGPGGAASPRTNTVSGTLRRG